MDIKTTDNGVEFERKLSAFVELTPQELADIFWAMPADNQARFFNYLSHVDGVKMANLLQAVNDDPVLHDAGRHVMSMIGDYSVKG